jgi:phosphopantothenoylcysteine decarboxylase / phosphopantothenate---cysteine ligase
MPPTRSSSAGGGQPLAGARILHGVTGGIAAYKAAEVTRGLMRAGAQVQPLLTADAERLITRATFAALSGRSVPGSVWDHPEQVTHVELARWGQLLLVAPATAHTLARLAHGLADDLLTNLALAFPGPLVLAPAMHTEMWEHPATRANLAVLTGRGAVVVPPEAGPLTSGDTGVGRLAHAETILAAVTTTLQTASGAAGGGRAGSLAGVRVLVTLGGTREPLDPVRYLGNRSSGRMGAAVVAEALARGARVTAVAAHAEVDVPAAARVVPVSTAEELYQATLAEAADHEVLILAAAVADFRPATRAAGKIKKERGVPELVLEPTPDTLAELGRRRSPGQVLVGFAAETDDHVAQGRAKLARKRADLLVVNHVEDGRSAFGATEATAYLIDAAGVSPLPAAAPKAKVAAALLDWVEAHRASRRP